METYEIELREVNPKVKGEAQLPLMVVTVYVDPGMARRVAQASKDGRLVASVYEITTTRTAL
jgi:hypothetical protein